jgi:SAM-dependent methyltransferase
MNDQLQQTDAAVEREFLYPSKRRPHYLERVSIVQAIRELRHRVKPGRLLDVGCGMKPYESLLTQRGSRYYGTDWPVSMEGSYGDLTRADFFSDSMVLPFREGTFDTVISTQMLEHVRHPEIVIPEMARVLKPDGILILSAPMTWPLHEEPFDYYRYTLHGLRHLLKEADFEILDEIRRGNNWTTMAQMFLDTQLGNLGQRLPEKLYSALAGWLQQEKCPLGNLPQRTSKALCDDGPTNPGKRLSSSFSRPWSAQWT